MRIQIFDASLYILCGRKVDGYTLLHRHCKIGLRSAICCPDNPLAGFGDNSYNEVAGSFALLFVVIFF